MQKHKTSALLFAALLLGVCSFTSVPTALASVVPLDTISSAIMLDTDGNGRLDQVDVTLTSTPDAATLEASDFTVDACTFSTPPYAVASAMVSADHVILTLSEISIGEMDTGVTCNVTVSGLSSTLGNPITGTVTALDGAAPVIREVEYMDVSGNGIIDQLIVRFSESLAPASVFNLADFMFGTVGDFTGTSIPTFLPETEMAQLNEGNGYVDSSMGWVAIPLTEGTAVDTHDDSGEFILGTTPFFAAYDLFSNGNTTAAVQTQAAVQDLASPLMKSLSYGDADGDGKIDTLDIIFTEDVVDASTLSANQLLVDEDGGFTGLAFGTDTADLLSGEMPGMGTYGFVRFPMTEASVVSTAASGAFSITYNPLDSAFLLVDASNNQSGAAAQTFTTLPVSDDAAVIIVSTNPTSGATGVNVDTAITVTFSEPMNIGSARFINLNPGVDGMFAFNQDGLTFVIDPLGPLDQNTLYTLTVGTGVDSVNDDSAPDAFAPVTFTTQAPVSSGGGGGGGGGGYIPPRPVTPAPVPAPAAPVPPQVLGTTDTSTVSADANGVKPGDYIRGTSWSTVYYVSADMVRHVFIDEQTYFTYQDSWDAVKTLPDAALADYPMGSLVLPKAGTVLVKIQSSTEVYALENDASGHTLLREIPNEMTAEYVFGSRWADYVIDVSPAFYKKFILGKAIDTSFAVNMVNMKTRAALNSH